MNVSRLVVAGVCAGIGAFVAVLISETNPSEADTRDRGAWKERAGIGAVIGFVGYFLLLDQMMFD